jgi:hypothetical protein
VRRPHPLFERPEGMRATEIAVIDLGDFASLNWALMSINW